MNENKRKSLKIIGVSAWSIPVISAVALPTHAQATERRVCRPESITYSAGTHDFTIPAGVTTLAVTVAGASGGSNTIASRSRQGGTGSLAIGNVNVSPGEVLQMVVGSQGVSTDGLSSSAGGTGYGNGGDGGDDTNDNSLDVNFIRAHGCGGGGGTAILRSGSPIVVSGGGGGASGPEDVAFANYDTDLGANGGNGDANGETVASAIRHEFGGRAGAGGNPGAGGDAGPFASSSAATVAGDSGSGNNGGAGASTFFQGGGGGGGGHGGGGGGGHGGGGGGGGSLATGAVSIMPGGARRGDGSITLDWEICS